MKRWHCWHDDGRYVVVKARDYRQAIDAAMEVWNETDINTVAVEEIE
jgi:hypothetical protein